MEKKRIPINKRSFWGCGKQQPENHVADCSANCFSASSLDSHFSFLFLLLLFAIDKEIKKEKFSNLREEIPSEKARAEGTRERRIQRRLKWKGIYND